MKINRRFWPALLIGFFVGLGMGVFVWITPFDAAMPSAPILIGFLAGIGTFILLFFVH